MLVAAGGNVVIADVNDAAGAALAAELGPKARFAHTEVTDEGRVRSAVALAGEAFGGLHGSIQCAGIVLAERVLGKAGAHPLEHFNRVVQINLVGTFNVLRLAADAMSKNKAGARRRARRHHQHGIGGRLRWANRPGRLCGFEGGYRQHDVASGTRTGPARHPRDGHRARHLRYAALGRPTRTRPASLGQQVPFPPRLGKPEEFAALVRHIIENEMLNGEVIRLDGALRMAAK